MHSAPLESMGQEPRDRTLDNNIQVSWASHRMISAMIIIEELEQQIRTSRLIPKDAWK